MDAHFQALMKTLFQQMGIDLPPDRQNAVYSVEVDEQVKMKFFAAPAGYLNMICDLGKLPEAVDPALLMHILKLNCFTPLFHDFNFKLGFNDEAESLELWLRQKLDGLNEEAAIKLFDFAVETAGYVKSWMEKPLTKQRSAQFMNRLTTGAGWKK